MLGSASRATTKVKSRLCMTKVMQEGGTVVIAGHAVCSCWRKKGSGGFQYRAVQSTSTRSSGTHQDRTPCRLREEWEEYTLYLNAKCLHFPLSRLPLPSLPFFFRKQPFLRGSCSKAEISIKAHPIMPVAVSWREAA